MNYDALLDRVSVDLKADEGFSATPYLDTEGVPTIGHGTNLARGISRAQAEALLWHDMVDLYQEMESAIKGPLDLAGEYQADWLETRPPQVLAALLNMAYNLGIPRLMGFKKMLAALERDDYALAAKEALDSKWAGQVGNRAKRIATLLRAGDLQTGDRK